MEFSLLSRFGRCALAVKAGAGEALDSCFCGEAPGVPDEIRNSGISRCWRLGGEIFA